MKRWLAWILALACLLSGCTGEPETPSDPIESTQPKATEPARSLSWGSCALEEITGGAVKVFGAEDSSINGMGMMDGDPVVLTAREDGTLVTRFDGETGLVKAEKLCAGDLYLGDWMHSNTVMAGNRLAYYDAEENVLRILDGALKEMSRIKLQHVPDSEPVFSADMSAAYYGVGGEIRAVDMKTGIARMVCQRAGQTVRPLELLLDDTILYCIVTDEDGTGTAEFLDAENGISLATDRNMLVLHGQGSNWLAVRGDASITEFLVGDAENVFGFSAEGQDSPLQLLPSGILSCNFDGRNICISLYGKENGKRLAQLELEGVTRAIGAVEDPSGRYIWLMCYDSLTQQDIMVRWEPALSGGEDETVRITTRYTAKNPDTAGLAAMKQEAQRIGEKYGVQIHLHADVAQADGFTITNEYQVMAFARALETLERLLETLPEEFLTAAAARTRDKQLHIGLIRSIQPDAVGGNPKTGGQHYLIDDNAWIVLSVGEDFEENFYHNLSHALDTYVYAHSIHYDFWSDCNPKDFQYDENYLHFGSHGDSPYLQDHNRAFIDAFSMTFPHEDRATVFAYALMEGTGDYFASSYMQTKLKQLCIGIRQAFGWEKSSDTFLWEQYLQESLAYKK